MLLWGLFSTDTLFYFLSILSFWSTDNECNAILQSSEAEINQLAVNYAEEQIVKILEGVLLQRS